ncbi:MAG: putative ATPase, partial [Gammaproteobacteria bacterium]
GRADGVPLFVEELAKAVLEVGDAASEIPATLRASLTARLDRLGDAKEVAQIGAAIGREYTLDVVRATGTKMGLAVDDLHQELVDSELVFPTISSQGAAYAFGHALVQEAAYETMLKSRRAILHRQIAEVLEAEFPSVVEARPETLARHFTEGAVSTSAIMYRRRAGEMCAGTLANVEAAHHFQQALELLLKQPAAAERDAEELQLRVASGGPLLMTKGHGSSEVEAAYTSALELSESLGDTSHLTPSLFGLWRHAVGRGDCNISGDLGQQLLELSDRSGNLPGQVLGHYGLGYTLFCRGSLEESLAHLEAGAELYALSLRTP